jgi:hypothetical protein
MESRVQTAISIITVLGAAVVAIATVLLWRVTAALARETERMADLTSRPHVVVTIGANRWSTMHADLEVENTGNATAYDIEVSFDPPLPAEGKARGGLPVPLQRISLLKPGQSISSYLSEFGLVIDNTYRVTVSWLREPSSSKREFNEYSLDLSTLKNISRLGASDPLVQIADQVKKIQEDLHRVVSGSGKPRIDVITSADRALEREMLEQRFRDQRGEERVQAKPSRWRSLLPKRWQ